MVVPRHTAEELKQRCYLEIVVRFNRDIPTLVTSSRVPEVQTQLDTYQLVSTHESLDSCRSATLAFALNSRLSVEILVQSLKISQKTFFGRIDTIFRVSLFDSLLGFHFAPLDFVFENIYPFFIIIFFSRCMMKSGRWIFVRRKKRKTRFVCLFIVYNSKFFFQTAQC